MAINTQPVFVKPGFDPPMKVITAVSETYAAPAATPDAIVTAGADGAQINSCLFKSQGATVANKLLLWLYDGTNYEVFDEILVPAGDDTGSVEIASWSFLWVPPEPKRLISGRIFGATKFVAGNVNFTATPFGGSLTA